MSGASDVAVDRSREFRILVALRRLPPLAVDGVIVAVLTAAGFLQHFGSPHLEDPGPGNAHTLVHGAIIVAALLPLLLRRRFPFMTMVIMTAVVGIAGSVGPLFAFQPTPAAAFGLLFAVFNATAAGGPAKGWGALVLFVAAYTLVLRPWVTPFAAWFPNYPMGVVAFVVGLAERQRREMTRTLESQIIDWDAHRQRLHRLALQGARTRLARELRGVVVGALERMKAHAQEAMGRLGPPMADPEVALERTEAAGRSALSEMRVLLDVLRRGDPKDQTGRRALAKEGSLPQLSDSAAPPSWVSRSPSVLHGWGQMGWPVDVVLVVALSIGALLELSFWEKTLGPGVPPATFSTGAHWWALAWILLLFFRRRFPVATGVAMAVMAFLQTYPFRFWTPNSDIWALRIAVFTIASLRPRRADAWVVALVGAIGLVSIPPPPVTLSVIGYLMIIAITLGGAAYVGTIVGERRRLNDELGERLSVLEEERRAEVALALQEERLGLAREMHDLVAHSLTLMVVQAGAARTVASADPPAARGAVSAVIDAGGQAMGELDQLLRVLGDDEEEIPAPARRDVEQLVDQAKRSGIDVDLERVGSYSLPAGSSLELSAYRIVQESLTNARKHAPGARVRVRMLVDPDAVAVRVENDGPSGDSRELGPLGSGQGLIGMRERVALFGGSLEAGPRPSGGFAVEAVMRLERSATG